MSRNSPDPTDPVRPSTSDLGSVRRVPSLRRRQTQQSEPTGFRTALSFAKVERQLTKAKQQPKGPKLEQGTFAVYNLRWERLRGFLEGNFPGYTFEERIVENDQYIFKIPKPLTAEDRVAIRKLLDVPDKAAEARSSSRSPERGPTLSRMMMQS